MRKLFIEGLVIFISILASLSVDNMRELSDEQEVLNEAVTTLGDEINSNIKYTKEHIKQVKNMFYLTSKTVDNFNEITFSQVLKIHSDRPYMHSIVGDGNIEYLRKYENEKPSKGDMRRPADRQRGRKARITSGFAQCKLKRNEKKKKTSV